MTEDGDDDRAEGTMTEQRTTTEEGTMTEDGDDDRGGGR